MLKRNFIVKFQKIDSIVKKKLKRDSIVNRILNTRNTTLDLHNTKYFIQEGFFAEIDIDNTPFLLKM